MTVSVDVNATTRITDKLVAVRHHLVGVTNRDRETTLWFENTRVGGPFMSNAGYPVPGDTVVQVRL